MAKFEDGKDTGALRTIGEVAAATGLRAHVLRYWEQQFPELRPLTRNGGRRYYRPEDIALVERIDRLVNHEGYTLKGAKASLRGRDAGKPVAGSDKPMPFAVAPETLAALRKVRADLKAALTS